MGKVFDVIDESLREWIAKQALFFVGTAPSGGDGHVNVSPKGPIGSLRVIDERTIAYLDCIGSGAETVAHLRENGRIVLMMCAFEGSPRILRIHGRGEVVLPTDARWLPLLEKHAFVDPGLPESRRSVIVVHAERISDSCGYGVPRMVFEGARPQMVEWCEKKLRDGGTLALAEYQERKNRVSLDGLPAMDRPSGGSGDGP